MYYYLDSIFNIFICIIIEFVSCWFVAIFHSSNYENILYLWKIDIPNIELFDKLGIQQNVFYQI